MGLEQGQDKVALEMWGEKSLAGKAFLHEMANLYSIRAKRQSFRKPKWRAFRKLYSV